MEEKLEIEEKKIKSCIFNVIASELLQLAARKCWVQTAFNELYSEITAP